MVRKIEYERRKVDLEAATQTLLDQNPEIWGRLMELRGGVKQRVLLLVQGYQVDPVRMQDQTVPTRMLTLEPGQVVVEVSGMDEAPRIRIAKMSGDVHWQMIEAAIMDKPARVIPIDEKTVLVMDDPNDPYTQSQEDPRVLEWEGIDAA